MLQVLHLSTFTCFGASRAARGSEMITGYGTGIIVPYSKTGERGR